MVNIEFTAGQSTFKINSISLVRNFHSYVHGNKLRIVNAYDTRFELLSYTLYSDVSVNGVVYGSVVELAEILSPILFLKKGGSDAGGVTTISSNIITRVVPVQIDWTQDSVQQIVNFVNSQQFVVLGTERILFKAARIIGDVETSNAVEFYYWEFKPGKGTYGVNGTNISGTHIEYISFVTNYQNNVINLGEIDVEPIEVFINDSGPYAINTASLNVFKTLRQGNPVNYIYIGSSNNIGIGHTQTVAGDFIDVNATPVNPPASTGGLDVPTEYGLIPMSQADGSLVWVPIPSGGDPSDGTISHGIVSFNSGYIDGFNFQPSLVWYFGGTRYTKTKAITLQDAPANAGFSRIDVIAGTHDGDIVVLTGVASENPEKPVVDPETQLEATFFIIESGAAAPVGITGTPIYNESGTVAGGEWDASETTGGARINLLSGNQTKSGNYAIEGTSLQQYDKIEFTPAAPLDIAEIKELSFNIKNKKAYSKIANPFVVWLVGKQINGKPLTHWLTSATSNGYDPQNTADWQFVSLPAPTSTKLATIDKITIRIEAATAEGLGFFLDTIKYTDGTTENQQPISGDFSDTRLSNLVSTLTEAEKTAIKQKLGVTEVDGVTEAELNAALTALENDLALQIDAVEEDVLVHEQRISDLENNSPGTGGGIGQIDFGLTGAIDGTNKVFQTSAPFTAGKVLIFLNGIAQTLGDDYTESTTQIIEFIEAPHVGDKIIAIY